jgi:hypothetical protein
MASVGATSSPNPDAEVAHTFHQDINCYLNIHAPITVFTTTTKKYGRTNLAFASESEMEAPRTPVLPPEPSERDTTRMVEPYTPVRWRGSTRMADSTAIEAARESIPLNGGDSEDGCGFGGHGLAAVHVAAPCPSVVFACHRSTGENATGIGSGAVELGRPGRRPTSQKHDGCHWYFQGSRGGVLRPPETQQSFHNRIRFRERFWRWRRLRLHNITAKCSVVKVDVTRRPESRKRRR